MQKTRRPDGDAPAARSCSLVFHHSKTCLYHPSLRVAFDIDVRSVCSKRNAFLFWFFHTRLTFALLPALLPAPRYVHCILYVIILGFCYTKRRYRGTRSPGKLLDSPYGIGRVDAGNQVIRAQIPRHPDGASGEELAVKHGCSILAPVLLHIAAVLRT